MIQPMMCAPRNRSFLSGIASRISFDAEEKNRLSWIKPTPPYKTRKYAAISRIAARIVTGILIPSF
mgnify:FL=1